MQKNINILTLFSIICMFLIITTANALPLDQKPEFKNFVNKMVNRYHFHRDYLQKLFANFQPEPIAITSVKHPLEKISWEKYKRTFITQERIADGVLYWQRHRATLTFAEQKYGVPASIIVSIVGVESTYGTEKMKHQVFKVLTTLSFYYPARSEFFKQELCEYLLLTRDLQISPDKIYGSYAGAIGLPQFMPSNYRYFAVAASPGKKPDLLHDTDDVVLSVANFLHAVGWHANEPIATPAKVIGEKYHNALFEKTEPRMTLQELRGYGVTSDKYFAKDYPAALLRFDRDDDYEDWIVFHNFNVLRNYNTSDLYAMVIYQLASEINQARDTFLQKNKIASQSH